VAESSIGASFYLQHAPSTVQQRPVNRIPSPILARCSRRWCHRPARVKFHLLVRYNCQRDPMRCPGRRRRAIEDGRRPIEDVAATSRGTQLSHGREARPPDDPPYAAADQPGLRYDLAASWLSAPLGALRGPRVRATIPSYLQYLRFLERQLPPPAPDSMPGFWLRAADLWRIERGDHSRRVIDAEP
jgi:hypothetical protein